MNTPSGWLQFPAEVKDGRGLILRAIHSMRHRVQKGVCCTVHSHRELEIVYHPMGTGVTRFGDRELRFDVGSAVIYAPGQAHDQVMDGKGVDVCLQLEVPEELFEERTGCLYIPPPIDPLVIAELEDLTCDRIWPPPRERIVINLRATAVLLSLLEIASGQGRRASMAHAQRHVMEAESYLNSHFQTIVSLRDVALHVGLSHDRLRHLFKEHRGISIIRRLIEIRLERARSLLTHSELPIKQIATLSGFRDEYYFSTVFRRYHHLSPRGFREHQKNSMSSSRRAGNGKSLRTA